MQKMGEDDESFAATSSGGNVRFLSLSPREAQRVMDQVNLVWPTIRTNKIRTVTPSNLSEAVGPSAVQERDVPKKKREPQEKSKNSVPDVDRTKSRDQIETPGSDSALNEPQSQSLFTGFITPGSTVADSDNRTANRAARQPVQVTETAEIEDENSDGRERRKSVPGADIVIAPGPNGIIISSLDLDALDAFEDLVNTLTDGLDASNNTYTVYYLRYEKADQAADLLNEILGNSSGDAGGTGSGGGLLGGLADAAMGGGGGGGGLLDSLFGAGGSAGLTTSGAISIVPNNRLNLLIVEANPGDLELIDQLLQIIDQDRSPEEVETLPPPRPIQLYNTNAEEIAEVVRSVYSERIAGASGPQQQPNPQDFIRALRGGGRGGRGAQREEEDPKISVAVDSRNNRLIVAAPSIVFNEIKGLVEDLDQVNTESSESTQVVTLRKADPAMVQRAIAAIVGGEPTTSSQPSSGGSERTQPGRDNNGRPSGGSNPAERFRQQAEFFRAMQENARRGAGRGGEGRGGERGGGERRGGGRR